MIPMSKKNRDESETEAETCTGQCGYSPQCRLCEREKRRKCMEAALAKAGKDRIPDRRP